MGTLKEKLAYLKETVDLLKGKNMDWLDHMSADGLPTLRSRIEFLMDCAKNYMFLTCDPWWHSREDKETFSVTLADGTEKEIILGYDCYYEVPAVEISYNAVLQPMTGRTNGTGNPGMFDFSKPRVTESGTFAVEIPWPCPSSLILNDRQALISRTVQQCPRDMLFLHGLKFGKCVTSCASNWLYGAFIGTWHGDVFVSVPEGFEGTVYLSKIPIKAECLVDIINNLADMSGTETTYTLNVGTDNLAKLTDEQIAIATEKGWSVT